LSGGVDTFVGCRNMQNISKWFQWCILSTGWTVKVKATKVQRESRGIALLFLLPRRWMLWVVNATPRPLYRGERPGTQWVGLRAGLDDCGKSRSHRDSNPGPSSPRIKSRGGREFPHSSIPALGPAHPCVQ